MGDTAFFSELEIGSFNRYRKKFAEIHAVTHCLNTFFSAIIKSINFYGGYK
jgi:hypothetical protein